jgi:hypothetical protein
LHCPHEEIEVDDLPKHWRLKPHQPLHK